MSFEEPKNKRKIQKKLFIPNSNKLWNLSSNIRFNESILNIIRKNKSLLKNHSNEIRSYINKKIQINNSGLFKNKMINYYMNIDKCRNKPPNLSYYDNSFNKKKKTDLLVNINNIKNRHHQKKNYKLFFQRVEFTRDNNNYRNNRNEDNSLKHMDSCHTMYFKNQKPSTLFYSIHNSFLNKNNNNSEEKNSFLSSKEGKCSIKNQKKSFLTKVDSVCQTKISLFDQKTDEQKLNKINIKKIKKYILPSIYRNNQLSSNRNALSYSNLSNESEKSKMGPISFEGNRGNMILDKEIINSTRYEKKKKHICLVNNYYINF